MYGNAELHLEFTCPVNKVEVEYVDANFEAYSVEEEVSYGDVVGHYIYAKCPSCGDTHEVYI